jgi:hypothetical protein
LITSNYRREIFFAAKFRHELVFARSITALVKSSLAGATLHAMVRAVDINIGFAVTRCGRDAQERDDAHAIAGPRVMRRVGGENIEVRPQLRTGLRALPRRCDGNGIPAAHNRPSFRADRRE